MEFLEFRKLGAAYALMRALVSSANSEGWVRYGQPLTSQWLAAECGVCRRTMLRWLIRLRADELIETEKYAGRGLRIRIAEQFRTRAYQMPLFNGPQAVRMASAKQKQIG
jgi:DNA-binding GntR family transcriptional regulator